jgi:hypothetical protein
MPEAHWPWQCGIAQLVDLRIANTARNIVHRDLVRAGIRDVYFLDYERPSILDLYGGFSLHDRLLRAINPRPRYHVPAADPTNTPSGAPVINRRLVSVRYSAIGPASTEPIAGQRLAGLDDQIAELQRARELLAGALLCRFDLPATDSKIMGAEIDRRLDRPAGP